MNEELKSQFINKALEYLNSAEAFLKAEVPAYVQELLTFHFYNNLLELIICIIISLIILIISRHFFIRSYDNETKGWIIIITIIAMSIPLSKTITASSNLLKISLAPRVFLIEHLTRK